MMPRKAVPGSLGVALDLADKASRPRPEERIVPEDGTQMDLDSDGGWVGIWESLHLNLPTYLG